MSKFVILKYFELCIRDTEDVLGVNATSNITLERFAKKIFGRRFLGTFSADDYPPDDEVHNGEMYIVNNQTSAQHGEHWVGCYKWHDGIYAYDSFARRLRHVSRHFGEHWNRVNSWRDQSYKEKNCGARSIAFLRCFDKFKELVVHLI